ncbi:MAG: ABC transporter permease [Deltaproteobacteria bacterium]|nr:ABC transporter permease [Deltaproteobacteria bacterium]
MIARILALMKKEFLALLKDKKGRMILILPPILQLMVFGYAATYDLKDVPYAIYNQDPGRASRDLLERFQFSPNFKLAGRLNRLEDAKDLINRGEVLMVVSLGSRFSADLLLGRPAAVQVILDGRNSNTAMTALGYARQIINQFNQDWSDRQGIPPPLAVLTSRAWFNPNLESRWFIVPGLVGLLTLVVTLVVTALSVAREREEGTFDQLLVTPLRPVEMLLGKALPGLIIGLVEASFIGAMAVVWFKVPFLGHIGTFYLGLFFFILSAIGVGLMISSLAATQQQGLLGAFLFLVPAVILSGYATPIANMPELVQRLTLLNPLRYFLVVVRGIYLEGATLEVLWPQFWPMGLIGLVALIFAGWLFRHRMY